MSHLLWVLETRPQASEKVASAQLLGPYLALPRVSIPFSRAGPYYGHVLQSG